MLCNNILDTDVRQEFLQALNGFGFGEADAAQLADAAMSRLREFDPPGSSVLAPKTVAHLIAVGVRAALQTSSDFRDAVKVRLPSRAPELWAERDKKKRESPIDFLRRVWGPYLDAGVLFQCDLKHLGETRLLPAIRVFCHNHGIQASSVLPPPMRAKLDVALAALPEGPVKAAVRNRVVNRTRSARHRQKPTGP